jgi:hypothetical protein
MEILNKLNEIGESLGLGREKVEQVKSDVEAFGAAKFEEGKKIGYDEGFAAGVASVPVSAVVEIPVASDKIYSQVELDEKIVIAKAEKLAEMKQKYQEAQAAESSIEAALFAEPVVEPVLEVPAEPVV